MITYVSMVPRTVLALAFACAAPVLLTATVALGQDVAAADALFNKAVADMDAGRYDAACPALAESQRLDPRSGTLFALATCNAKAGKIATAKAFFDDYLRSAGDLPAAAKAKHADRIKIAKGELDKLRPQIPTLKLVLPSSAPAEAHVHRDGTELSAAALGVALPIDPGEHVVVVEAPGRARAELRFTVEKGENKVAELPVGAALAAGPCPRRAQARPRPTARAPPRSGAPAAFVAARRGRRAGDHGGRHRRPRALEEERRRRELHEPELQPAGSVRRQRGQGAGHGQHRRLRRGRRRARGGRSPLLHAAARDADAGREDDPLGGRLHRRAGWLLDASEGSLVMSLKPHLIGALALCALGASASCAQILGFDKAYTDTGGSKAGSTAAGATHGSSGHGTGGQRAAPARASGTGGGSSASGGGGSGGSGVPVPCKADADCTGLNTDCAQYTCKAMVCAAKDAPSGTAIAAQTVGNCQKIVCDGHGSLTLQTDDTNVPDNSNPCTKAICTKGTPSNPPEPAGTACGASLACDGEGHCAGCVSPGDCPGMENDCQSRSCTNGLCGFIYTAAGTAVTMQTAGDCKKNVCNGMGAVSVIFDPKDVPASTNPLASSRAARWARRRMEHFRGRRRVLDGARTAARRCATGAGAACSASSPRAAPGWTRRARRARAPPAPAAPATRRWARSCPRRRPATASRTCATGWAA